LGSLEGEELRGGREGGEEVLVIRGEGCEEEGDDE